MHWILKMAGFFSYTIFFFFLKTIINEKGEDKDAFHSSKNSTTGIVCFVFPFIKFTAR